MIPGRLREAVGRPIHNYRCEVLVQVAQDREANGLGCLTEVPGTSVLKSSPALPNRNRRKDPQTLHPCMEPLKGTLNPKP